MADYIDRQATIDALWKALFEYEDKTEKQFIETGELDVEDWVQHRVFVQNMNDIDRQTILDLPSADAQPVRHGHWAEENGFIYCPFCGNPWGAPGCESMVKSFNYCPNCGARMDGERK